MHQGRPIVNTIINANNNFPSKTLIKKYSSDLPNAIVSTLIQFYFYVLESINLLDFQMKL